jgi:hypothetical protein
MRTTVAILSLLSIAFVGCEKREEKKMNQVEQGARNGAKKADEMKGNKK